MSKVQRWRWAVIALVILCSLFGLVNIPRSKEELVRNWNRNVRLGLDLQGGSHLVFQVQLHEAFHAEADMAIDRIKEAVSKSGGSYEAIDRTSPSTIESAAQVEIHVRGVKVPAFGRLVEESAGTQWSASETSTGNFTIRLRPEAATQLARDVVTQSIHILDRKVSGLGLAETSVQQRGGSSGANDILIQLPGVSDPGRVKGILQTAAKLELCEVKGGPWASREAALAEHGGVLPLGTRIVQGVYAGGQPTYWLLMRSPVVTGRDVRDASPRMGESGAWETGFVLSQDAARRFERYTGANIGNRLAIVLDDVVLSAPRIENQISDQGRIMGAGGQQEASDLALNLRAGSLPARLQLLEERTVGPSLGADSIRQGLTSGLLGLALVIASMIGYYRGAGWNAVFALILNTVMTVAALGYAGAAWTLPGIAGLVLSIGMAVDSNVLIFERIKEELAAGKAIPTAIAAGFDRALVTIIDTHVTTVVASAFLFLFGTGPVRGFAVTLVIGLVANLFTAVFVSRVLFDWQLQRNPRMSTLSIGKGIFGVTSFDFLKWRGAALGLSLIAIALSAGGLVWNGGPKYGLDFRGGALLEVQVTPNPPIDELRNVLSAGLPGEITVQESRAEGTFLIGAALAGEESLEGTRNDVERTLRSKYGDRFALRSAEIVGPKAGAELRRQALLATLYALGGMLLYIAFRFQWVSGAAAVLATAHDVLITLGLLLLTGRELNLNIVAALLTLIGYSMNDKIVVFDRVRENRNIAPRGRGFFDLVNLSINQTLSRTMLTAGPTLLACLALYLFGGEVLNGIAFALFTGIVVGTYSSIFIASALLVYWEERRPRKIAAGRPALQLK